MGIRGLNKLISLHSQNHTLERHISTFKGSKIAIDSEILIYQYRSNGELNSHIYGFLNNVFWHLKNGIIPVYVFDGAPSLAKKKNVLIKRMSQKEKIYQKAEELEIKFLEQLETTFFSEKPNVDTNEGIAVLGPDVNDTLDELFKVQRKISSMNVKRNHRHECKYLLKLMGIPFLNAKEDAEALCVSLYYSSLVDYVYTEDTDALVYSAARLAQKDSVEGRKESLKILKKNAIPNTVTIVDTDTVINSLELDYNQFIDLCIISGCDFCSTIPKIGPIKSYGLITKYGSIEGIKAAGVIDVPSDFEYEEARLIFKNSVILENSLSDRHECNVELSTPDIEGLKKYLITERNITDPSSIIDKLDNALDSYRNIRMD